MINILMISVKKMDTGGIESYLMTLLRNFPSDIHIDFVVHSDEKGSLEEEINSKGSKIYKLPRLSKQPIKYCKELYRIIIDGDYDIVHRHATASIMWIDLAIAKWAGCKNRIAHSHNSSWNHKYIHTMFIPFLNHYSTDRFACSNAAGKWMYKKSDYIVMKNGIDVNKFCFDSVARNEYRKMYNIENKKVVLMVARMVPEKNHLWFIEVVRKTISLNNDIVFVFAGEGVLFEQFKSKIKEYSLENNTLILGDRNDIPMLLSMSDLFVLPSLFEGLPITVIEAQCSGVKCLISDRITSEVDLGSVKRISLDEKKWVDELSILNIEDIELRKLGISMIYDNEYALEQTVKAVENYYKKIMRLS